MCANLPKNIPEINPDSAKSKLINGTLIFMTGYSAEITPKLYFKVKKNIESNKGIKLPGR